MRPSHDTRRAGDKYPIPMDTLDYSSYLRGTGTISAACPPGLQQRTARESGWLVG